MIHALYEIITAKVIPYKPNKSTVNLLNINELKNCLNPWNTKRKSIFHVIQ